MPEKLTDFRVFLTLVWRHLNLPDPTPIQLDIALYLQHGPRRKIIEAFRGVGKSWITAAYVVWRPAEPQPQIHGAVRIERPRRQLHDVLHEAHQ